MCERDTEELDEDEDEELESGSVETRSTLTESDGINHEDPVQDTTEGGIRNLGDELADGERLSRVDTTVVFANEDHPVQNPQRGQLSLDNGWHDANPETRVHRSGKELKRETVKISHCEHSRLKITSAVSELQEAQGDDERDNDMDEQASVDVVG